MNGTDRSGGKDHRDVRLRNRTHQRRGHSIRPVDETDRLFVWDQLYLPVQSWFTEKRFVHSSERLSTGEAHHIRSRSGPRGRNEDDTDSSADTSPIRFSGIFLPA